MKKDPAEWLYLIHNQVNHKLRTQCAYDKKVVNPGENPSFEEVKSKYEHKTLNGVHGREFLMSVAVNYKETVSRTRVQETFLKELSKVYPEFSKYYHDNPPHFGRYAEWMSRFTGISEEEASKFISKCKKGRTCRKKQGGGRRLTRRV